MLEEGECVDVRGEFGRPETGEVELAGGSDVVLQGKEGQHRVSRDEGSTTDEVGLADVTDGENNGRLLRAQRGGETEDRPVANPTVGEVERAVQVAVAKEESSQV